MGQESSSSQLFLSDIVIERTDDLSEARNLKEFWIFGIPAPAGDQCFPLVKTSPSEWEILGGCIEIGILIGARFKVQMMWMNLTASLGLRRVVTGASIPAANGLADRLNEDGGRLLGCFESSGDLSKLSEAISAHRRAVKLTHQGHESLPRRLSNLGVALINRFSRIGDIMDANGAISAQKMAVWLTPEGHSDLARQLFNLGCSFLHRYKRRGDYLDVAEAISAQQRAVQLTPHGHPEMPIRLSTLGHSLVVRFDHTGDVSDISQAVSVFQEVVRLTPPGRSGLNDLGCALNGRFSQTEDISDVNEAISVHQRAIQLTPQGHADMHRMLRNLGNAFSSRFNQTGELSDITEAISAQHEAANLTNDTDADLPGHLANLGAWLKSRYQKTGDPMDMFLALVTEERAVKLVPEGHHHQPAMLTSLGDSYRRFFRSRGNSDDLEKSIFNYKSAANCSFGSPHSKLKAAIYWAMLLNQHYPLSSEILPAFETALGIVASISGLGETVRGRYNQLQKSSGLALQAAAAACALNRADKALEWLEQGRCLVWNQLKNLRSPLDELESHDSALARGIQDIAMQLENAGSSRSLSNTSMSLTLSQRISAEDEARAHLKLARQWDDLLRTARTTPGFESFLMPLPCSTLLKHLPESGPVVVINIDDRRCDALALLAGADEPLHIPLPNFSIEKASRYRADLDSELASRHLRSRGVRPAHRRKTHEHSPTHRVLRGLWEEVVRPILDALRISKMTEASKELLPRLWWCPTGPLTFLPLHAAGIYRGSNPESVLDYVVSSYTPTVTALADRVKNRRSIDPKASGLFLTSQPNAPGASVIPGTMEEVKSIFDAAKKTGVRVLKLEGDEVSVDECLDHMRLFSSIHLACHASQNAAEPLQSRFLFHKGSLELATILKSNLKNAELAFLSACQTSTGDANISDEAVHLAAGMLAAGYRRVVATMWSIGDQSAQEVATRFYDYILSRRGETSGTTFDGSLSSYALHDSVQQLRHRLDNSEDSLLEWAPFVHFGY
ncbi:CHAT domain-containing protein [Ephemerocybe angulata]|uniref:CHAT domain-containing protein n=1 Tax=Ephemerocybe angulata TaxID=980116 RepID=A0A8H6M8K2_9AGAR|nr:CHAT domain-containing protein [Tulosesus angulatus]